MLLFYTASRDAVGGAAGAVRATGVSLLDLLNLLCATGEAGKSADDGGGCLDAEAALIAGECRAALAAAGGIQALGDLLGASLRGGRSVSERRLRCEVMAGLGMLGSTTAGPRLLREGGVLRLLSMIPSMKHVTALLLKASPRVLDVAMLYCLFLAIFAVLGVQLFGGRLSSCTHEIGKQPRMSRRACEEAGGEWLPPAFGSFDNVGAAALLLFEVTTFEKWPRVMFACIDAVDFDVPPTRNAHPAKGLFVIAWVVIGAMCLVNLFVVD